MKHNAEIPSETRTENAEYNARWIAEESLIGDATIPLDRLDVEASVKADANLFMPVWLKNIDRLCSRLSDHVDHRKYTLVDVGCGSGISTIYFYKKYFFKHLVGFDFSASLIGMANQNKNSLHLRGANVESLSFQIGDAKAYRLPQEPVVLFVFNSFGWETMRTFIENNIDALRSNKSVMLYANDHCVNEMAAYSKVLSRDDFYNLSVIGFGTD